MKCVIRLFLAPAAMVLGLISNPVLAMFDAEFLISPNRNLSESQTLGFHFSPLPLPASLGLSVSRATQNFESASLKQSDRSTFVSNSAAIELKLWSPKELLGITPYGRFSYTLLGRASLVKNKSSESQGNSEAGIEDSSYDSVKGRGFGVGLSINPLPFLKLFSEYAWIDTNIYESKTQTSKSTAISSIRSNEFRFGFGFVL